MEGAWPYQGQNDTSEGLPCKIIVQKYRFLYEKTHKALPIAILVLPLQITLFSERTWNNLSRASSFSAKSNHHLNFSAHEGLSRTYILIWIPFMLIWRPQKLVAV